MKKKDYYVLERYAVTFFNNADQKIFFLDVVCIHTFPSPRKIWNLKSSKREIEQEFKNVTTTKPQITIIMCGILSEFVSFILFFTQFSNQIR